LQSQTILVFTLCQVELPYVSIDRIPLQLQE
jgi:hypothetical protein